MGSDNELIMSREELAVAVSEGYLEGLVEFRDDEEIALTQRGLDYALDIWRPLPSKDKLVMALLLYLVEDIRKMEEE